MVSTLNDVLMRMKELNDKGYNCYFEGQGNGNVKPFAEGIFITDIVNKIKKENKNKR